MSYLVKLLRRTPILIASIILAGLFSTLSAVTYFYL